MRRARINYSADEMEWLQANYRLVISDYRAAFVARFGREDVRPEHLNALRKRKGWKVGRDVGRYVGRLRAFSDAECAWLSANRTLPIADYYRAFQAQFGRPDITTRKLHALRKRQGWKTGRTGRYEKGAEPLNKGKVCPPGTGGRHPNARATQFRAGERSGVAVKLWKPIGTERVSKGGYIERKIHDGMPMQSRWRAVHLVRWEELNGPLPDGYALKCLDGDKANTDPSNWEALPRAVLARLNGGRHRRTLAYDDAAPEVKPAVMAVAKLKHAVQIAREAQRG